MSVVLHRSLALVAAVAVGVFHGFLKPLPSAEEKEALESMLREAGAWQGRYAADFEVPLLDGERFRLADAVGDRAILLNFFATWCQPCREEMPELLRFRDRHAQEPLLVLFVDVAEPEEKVRDFVDSLDLDAPVALDTEGTVAASYGVTSYPLSVLIDRSGRIALYQRGAIANADVALAGSLAEALSSHPTTAAEYLARLEQQPPWPGSARHGEGLTGRGREIAAEMSCPCGCTDRVLNCSCQTADEIKKRLREPLPEDRSDEEIVTELNAEFCVGSQLARRH